MNQKRFFDLVEKALSPMPLGDFCFPIRWCIALAMVSISCGAFIAAAVLHCVTEEECLYVALAFCLVTFAIAIELSVRIISAHKDVEIKKLDVLKEEIVRRREESEHNHEELLCCSAGARDSKPEVIQTEGE